jgi:cation diffusion facilitator CzcD-associated flavoprotein CzcO
LSSATTIHSVIVIGAGFGGIGMAIRLKKSGYDDFIVLERAPDIGGVWHANRYPGAACDVESHLYCYSFETDFDWSSAHGKRDEILTYLRNCVAKYRIGPHIQLGTAVERAAFDDARGHWIVRTAGGGELRSRALVSACGLFNTPSIPRIEGADSFKGLRFHSAQWEAGFEPAGRRIAVIGTGCSAAQFVPEIVSGAERLLVFQRTPAFVGPRPEKPFSARKRRLYRWLPFLRKLDRLRIYRRNEKKFAVQRDPARRRVLEQEVTNYVTRTVSDVEKRAKLIPTYEAGCKRNVRSGLFLPSLDRPNVDLVTTPIRRIAERGIETADGRLHEVDTIIYGTGFTTTDYLSTVEVRGANGLELREAWKNAAEAYLGVSVAGFPNFFIVYGPNTNSPNSIIFMIECQIGYILKCIGTIFRKNLRSFDVSAGVQARYNEDIQHRLKTTSWASGCVSYFMNAAGRIVTQWPDSSGDYRRRVRRLRLKDYDVA